jgi:hypothetical protein
MAFEVVDSDGEVCKRVQCSVCSNYEDFTYDELDQLMENDDEDDDAALIRYLYGENWDHDDFGLYIHCDVCSLNKRNHKLYGKYHPYDNKYVTDEDDDEAIANFLLEGKCVRTITRQAVIKLIKTWRKALLLCKPYRSFKKYKQLVEKAEEKKWALEKYVENKDDTMYVFLCCMRRRAAGPAEVQKKRKRDDTSPFVSSQLAQRCYENTDVCRAIMKFL